MSTETKSVRRSERKEASRQRLFDASLECLAELGFASTTTTAIAQRAGMSNGALFHFYRSKEELLVAAVAERVRGLRPDLGSLVHPDEQTLDGARVLDASIAALRSPAGRALLEMYSAARTSQRLADALQPTFKQARDEIVDALTATIAAPVDRQQVAGLVGVVLTSALGITVIELSMGIVLTDTRTALRQYVDSALATSKSPATPRG